MALTTPQVFCSALLLLLPLLLRPAAAQDRALLPERVQGQALLPAEDSSEAFSPGVQRRVLTRTRFGQDQVVSTRQGPLGFAYEVSHPVLDEYGQLQTATQYHGQDGLGRYRYSYRHPGSRREEYVDEKGRVQGSFSYKSDDEDDISMSYYADDSGFHVKRAVLPPLAARAPRDEPLVAAIKAAHIRLWRQMWLRAATLSVGQPLPEDTPELMVPLLPPVLPPADTAQPAVPSPPSEVPAAGLDSEVISFDDDSEQEVQQPPAPAADQPVVPIFPGAPDAPARPVSSGPEALPVGAGLSSPDQQTIVVEAGDGPALTRLRPLGALRFGRLPEARSLRTSVVAEGRLDEVRALRRAAMAQVRVSEEAARLGGVPVAARHDRAQVRPQQLDDGRPAPVLDDPLLYYYSDLLYEANEAAKTPELVVV